MTELDLISLYTRADAIRDGLLIEVDPALCREVGVVYPVCITDNLWVYIEPSNLADMPGQSVKGRLWDLLWMIRIIISNPKNKRTDTIRFRVSFMLKDGRQPASLEEVFVIGRFGPGDNAEPVITLMLPEDD